MADILIWGYSVPRAWLSQAEADYLVALPQDSPKPEWFWNEIDRVWDNLKLDNKKSLRGQPIGDFYSHPVWVANGVFSSVDPVSAQHREFIAVYVSRIEVKRVADYGGGFGELALRLRAVAPDIRIDIVEPYPSKLGMLRVDDNAGIQFVKEFDGLYDCVIAQDVLEHVEQPLELAEKMVQATKPGGYLIFANCFSPVIKCHLPSAFYLRHTFTWVVRGMGLKFVGRVGGANHALVFQRVGGVDKNRVKRLAAIAKFVGPFLNTSYSLLGAIKRKVTSK